MSAVSDPNPSGWRARAVARSLEAARTRAEERVQRFLDAAFAIIDERGTTEFTVQDVVDRSKQSLRSFYEYFDGKDELVLALFEETVRAAFDDIRGAVDAETEPLARLRAFALQLYEWCDPAGFAPSHGRHNRRPVVDFTIHLASAYAERVRAALTPQARLLSGLIDDADAAGVIHVTDARRASALVQQTLMHASFGNRLVENPKQRLTAEETWEFCFRALQEGPR